MEASAHRFVCIHRERTLQRAWERTLQCASLPAKAGAPSGAFSSKADTQVRPSIYPSSHL